MKNRTATNKAKYIGKVDIGKTVGDGRINCHMISYKSPNKYRRTKKIGRSHTTKKCAAANREPWILITSITAENKYKLSSITKNIYTRRMEIEQNFRIAKLFYLELVFKNFLLDNTHSGPALSKPVFPDG